MEFVLTNTEKIEITNSSLICDKKIFSRVNKSMLYTEAHLGPNIFFEIRYNEFLNML